jgi:carbon starvation protein
MNRLLAYWYHFAIMFEALFVLTTIDTGTRIGRFLMQEMLGRIRPSLGKSTSKTGGILATGLIVGGFTYFILTGSIQTLWPMFGVANQLLACTALAVGSTILLREATRKRYALVTLIPLAFVGPTTIYAGVESIRKLYIPMLATPELRTRAVVNIGFTSVLLAFIVAILVGSSLRWSSLIRAPRMMTVDPEVDPS